MPPLTQAGRIDCANLPCYTKGGVRTQGSKSCIEFKCKPCCSNAALQVFANGIGRPQCNAHSQAAVVEQQVVQMDGPVQEEPIPPFPTILDPLHPPTSSSNTDMVIDPQLLALSTPTSSTPSALPPTCPIPTSTSIPSSSLPVVSQPLSPTPIPSLAVSRGSGRSLAQPLDLLWADVCNQAVNKKEKLKSAKAQTQAMDDRRCRTCLLVLYHTVCNHQPFLKLSPSSLPL